MNREETECSSMEKGALAVFEKQLCKQLYFSAKKKL
jgi:hypothetical protein